MSTVATFVSSEAFARLPKGDKAITIIKLVDPYLLAFFQAQADIAKEQMALLDPDQEKDPVKFMQAAKDARQTWRFWTDLIAFANDWAASVGVPQ